MRRIREIGALILTRCDPFAGHVWGVETCLGHVWDRFFDHLGTRFGWHWDVFRITLELLWDVLSVTLGHASDTFGTFLGTLGIVWGTSGIEFLLLQLRLPAPTIKANWRGHRRLLGTDIKPT